LNFPFGYECNYWIKSVFLRLNLMFFRIVLLTCLLLVNPVQAKSAFVGVVSYVSDGDTLWVQPDAGGRVRKLRIDGIDAPEICQPGGKASRDLLAQRALHQRVQVIVRRHDVYGRGLARIELNGRDLGEQMVQAGQAWSYRWRRDAGPYATQEAVARQSRLGLFAESQAVLPRDFRKRHGSCYTPK
jgi:micrococcal nuclease